MKVGILFSGGKDSTFAAFSAKKEGHDLVCLISIVSENPSSYMFHTPAIEMAEKQAEAMEIPILVRKTKGEKEKELDDLKEAISEAKRKYKIGGIVTGAVESVYQSSRIQKIADDLGLECINPLWHKWSKHWEKYWDELLKNGFEIMIVGVASDGLGKEWLGKKIDNSSFAKLKNLSEKYKFHLGFEGGEAETFVLDCPLFKKRIEVIEGKAEWKENSGVYVINKIRLIKK